MAESTVSTPLPPELAEFSKVPVALAIFGGSFLVATSMVLEHKGYRDYAKAILVTTVLTGGILSAIRSLTSE